MELDFTPPLYLFHLSGGLQILYGSNDQALLLDGHRKNSAVWSSIGKPTDILNFYPEIRAIGESIFRDTKEMKEAITPNYYLCETSGDGRCLDFSQRTFWSGVANTLSEDGEEAHAHFCRRLATQIFKSTRRLEKLSMAYRFALNNLQVPKVGKVTLQKNKYASNVGNEFGSLLDDLYALRDAINVVFFKIFLRKSTSFSTPNLRKAMPAWGTNATADMIAGAMFEADRGDMIISKMSTYRAVSLHSMGTSNPVIGDSLMVRCAEGPLGEIASIVYPLYDDIDELKEIEAGKTFGARRDRASILRFATLDKHLDGMEFAYDCFVRLLRIAESLGKDIAVEPRLLTLTDADVREATITDEDGNSVHYVRDSESGQLVKRKEKL